MESRPSSSHPGLASATTPQFEVNDDHDDLMAGGDFEAEQQAGHHRSASTSFTSAHEEHPATLHASIVASSTPPSTAGAAKCPSSANALHNTAPPRRNDHQTEAPSEKSPARLSSANPSRHTSRSPSSLFSTGSGDEDEYLPGDSEDEDEGADGIDRSTASSQLSAQTTTASTFRIGQNVYSSDEDAILRDAVKQHGTRWVKVAKEFNQLSRGMTRSKASLEKRWQSLLKSGKVQADPRGRQTRSWTEDETNVLLKSLHLRRKEDGHRPYSEHLVDFRNAFPNSTRSDKVISDKCYHLYQKQISERRSSTSGSHTNTASLNAAEAPASSSPLENRTPASRGSPLASNQEHDRVSVLASSTSDGLQVDLDDPAHLLIFRGEGSPISPSGTTSTQGNVSSSRRHTQSQRQSQPRRQTVRHPQRQVSQSSVQPHDVNVLIEQNSVCIENCPRDFHIAIYSETLVKITREAPAPSIVAFGRSYEAAFLFYVRPNGAIRALRLPEDTTTDVNPVPASDSCDAGAYVDTVFTGPDDFVVLFRSRL